MSKTTQCDRILRHLNDFGSITQAEASNEYGIARLASRICDLKKRGVLFDTETVYGKNRYGEQTKFTRYSIRM